MRSRTYANTKVFAGLDYLVLGSLVLLTLVLLALALVQPVRAAEIIPQIGMSRTPAGSDQAKASYGLAVRSKLAPFVDAELSGGYRSEPMTAGAARLIQWPVTASLWAHPFGGLYAGGGAGWYHTTLEYAGAVIPNTTTEKFGTHLGGGLELPLVPGVASLDVNGRYVYLGNQSSSMPPRQWKADFWTTNVGLALHF